MIDVLEKPIKRIKETCEMVGAAEKFERALPELETYLEGEVANGETSETRLTYDGLCFLKEAFARLWADRLALSAARPAAVREGRGLLPNPQVSRFSLAKGLRSLGSWFSLPLFVLRLAFLMQGLIALDFADDLLGLSRDAVLDILGFGHGSRSWGRP
jgi:hypothetical protein